MLILQILSLEPAHGYGIAGREAKFYSLTRAGEKQLAVEKQSWNRLTAAVRLIFNEGK